ncbi:GntR family transcriptional regulator [Bradyrhizobium sp. 13971]
MAAREGDSEQYYADNRDFHEAIYRASRNSFLADLAFALRKRLSAYRRIQLRARNSLLQSLQEHAGILKAIRAGDEQLAASRLHDHVLVQGERFSDTVLALPGIDDPLRLEAEVGRRNRGRCLKPKIEEGSAGIAGVRKGR